MQNKVYIFGINQLEVLNELVFDSSFHWLEPEETIIGDNFLELKIERRVFECVTRKKSMFGTTTFLEGKTSFIRFENVSNIAINHTPNNLRNDFIDTIDLENNSQLSINSRIYDLRITMTCSELTKILLEDIRQSDFGAGKVGGECGYTSDEWADYLVNKNIIYKSQDN